MLTIDSEWGMRFCRQFTRAGNVHVPQESVNMMYTDELFTPRHSLQSARWWLAIANIRVKPNDFLFDADVPIFKALCGSAFDSEAR